MAASIRAERSLPPSFLSSSPSSRAGPGSINPLIRSDSQLSRGDSIGSSGNGSPGKLWVHIPYIPFLYRIKPYRAKDLLKDALSGVIAAVVAIPQGLAYAMLASLPPVVGLYTAAMAPMVYAVLGTSNVCSIGPNALVTMFLPQIIVRLKFGPDPVAASGRASLAAVAVGAVMMCIGLARLGGLVRFISSPVLAGFTNAAALVMAMSQLPNLLGFYMPGFPYNYQQLSYLVSHILTDTNHLSLSIGLGTIILLYAFRAPRKFYPKSKAAKALFTASTLIVVVLATLIARCPRAYLNSGCRAMGFNDVSDVGDIIAACFPVALVAFMSQWSVARKYAEKTNQVDILDPNQEAFALGAANIISGCFHCFPTAASFSRTALNADSGARSPLANLFVGVVVLVALIAFTPYLYYLPLACLGGIIEVALLNLIETEPFYRAYRVARPDFIVMVASFVFTAVVNIQSGLVMGIILSIAVLLQELSDIQTSVLVPVIRLVTSVFFGNTDALKETFKDILSKGGDKVFAVVIDAAGVSHIDLSGLQGLEDMLGAAQARGVQLIVLHAQGTFRDRLGAAELWEALGCAKYEYKTTDEVVNLLLLEAELHREQTDPEAPSTWKGHSSSQPRSSGSSKRAAPFSPLFDHVADGSSAGDGEAVHLLTSASGGGGGGGGANTTPGGTFKS